MLITNFWQDQKVTALVENETEAFLSSIIQMTKEGNLYNDFIYENYAAAGFQKPLQASGNLDYFRQVASKYDPHQLFQRQAVGGWKLY